MAGLYLDENMSLAVGARLHVRGHIVTSTAAEGRLGTPDPRLLLEAAEQGWTLVTHNRRDFRLLHDAWHTWTNAWGTKQDHAGILVLDRVVGQTPEETAALIDSLVRDPQTRLSRALYDWKPARNWVRFPG